MIDIRNKKEVEQLVRECVTDFFERYSKLEPGKRVEVNPWLVWKYFDIMCEDSKILNELTSEIRSKCNLELKKSNDEHGYKFTVQRI